MDARRERQDPAPQGRKASAQARAQEVRQAARRACTARGRSSIARHPVHVVLRAKRRLSWREGRTYGVLRRVLRFYLGNPDFRICHISIQKNHLHMIVEATRKQALSRGMQSFAIRAARALNSEWGSCDEVFAERYHASQITTASYARHALAYVLNNWRRHREDFANGRDDRGASRSVLERRVSFDGWTIKFAKHPTTTRCRYRRRRRRLCAMTGSDTADRSAGVPGTAMVTARAAWRERRRLQAAAGGDDAAEPVTAPPSLVAKPPAPTSATKAEANGLPTVDLDRRRAAHRQPRAVISTLRGPRRPTAEIVSVFGERAVRSFSMQAAGSSCGSLLRARARARGSRAGRRAGARARRASDSRA